MIAPRSGDWKSWHRAVRRKIRTSEELRRDYKARRAGRRKQPNWAQFRIAVPLVLLVMIFGPQMPMSYVLNLLLLWTCFVTAARAQQILFAFHNTDVLNLLFQWPVSDEQVFNGQRRQLLNVSWWLVADWLVFGFAMALRESDGVLALVTPVFALAQWAASFAVALWAVRWAPRFPFTWLTAPAGLIVVLVMRGAHERDWLTPYIENLWRAIYAATPAGWIGQIWLNIFDENAMGYALLFVAVGIAALLWLKAWQATRAAFDLNKTFGYETEVPVADNVNVAEGAGSVATSLAGESPKSETTAKTVTMGTEVSSQDLEAATLKCRAHAAAVFGTPPGGALRDRGAIEQAQSWFLTQREHALIDILMPLGYRWSYRWVAACGLIMLSVAMRQFSLVGSNTIGAMGLGAIIMALPVFGGRWFGLQAFRTFQTQVGLCVYAPAGFWELARLVLKLNALRCIAGLPFIILAVWAMWGSFSSEYPDIAGLCDFSLRTLIIVLAAQPLWLIGKLSPNTTDSSGRWYYITGMWIVLIFLATILVTLFLTGLMVTSPLVALGCLGGLLLITHGCLAVYGFAWNRGWFDLLAKQK